MRAKEFVKKPATEAEMPWKDAVDAGAMTTQQGIKTASSDIEQHLSNLEKNTAAIGKEIATQRAAANSVPSNVQVTSMKPDGSWTGRTLPSQVASIGPVKLYKGGGNSTAGGPVKKAPPAYPPGSI